MEGRRGGSSTPSYKDVIASIGKSALGKNVRGYVEEGKKNIEKEIDGTKTKENSSTKDKEEDKSQGDKKQKGPCKPKAEITARVVLKSCSAGTQGTHGDLCYHL